MWNVAVMSCALPDIPDARRTLLSPCRRAFGYTCHLLFYPASHLPLFPTPELVSPRTKSLKRLSKKDS
jgi:hypothetical protein